MAGRKNLWKKGDPSPNPAGRPKGKGKKILIADALDKIGKERQMDVRKEIVETLIDKSLDGDMIATKILLDRLEPPFKPISIPIDLGVLPSDPLDKSEKIIDAVTSGAIPADLGHQLIASVANMLKISESSAILERLAAIEKKLA